MPGIISARPVQKRNRKMKRTSKAKIAKILMLALAAMLMLLLCGCRTRITNNTEVLSVLDDEGGWLNETYQSRRDELGIPTAEEPIIKGWGSADDSDDYDDYYVEDADTLDDYDPDDFTEPDEPEEETTENKTTTTTPSTTTTNRPTTVNTTRRPSSTTTRRPSSTTTTTTTKVTVTLDPNGGKCKTNTVKVTYGQKYGTLPTPTRSGYKFTGWYTSESGGSKVTSSTKVATSKSHKLYAHWEEQEKPTYTVTFDGNGEDDLVELSSESILVEEGGTYGDLPTAKRELYKFQGWYTEDGKQVKSGDKYTLKSDQTLYAKWEKDSYLWWDNEFKADANTVTDEQKVSCTVDDGDKTERAFVENCKGKLVSDEETPDYVIKFIKNFSDEAAQAAAEEVYAKYAETNPTVTVIIISDDALKGSDSEQLLYKLMLLDALYAAVGTDSLDKAAADLEAEGITPYIYQAGM